MIHKLQEHEQLTCLTDQDDRFEGLNLVKWDRPEDSGPFGYYASFRIGAEWVDENEAIVVTTKRRMESIDFLRMFMSCISSELEADSFSEIYSIQSGQEPIEAPALRSVLSSLIVVHFLSVVSQIKTLKKDYVHHSGNLNRIKGRVNILQNERKNLIIKRYNKVFCEYDEYSADIPENRLIKKALQFCREIVSRHNDAAPLVVMMNKALSLFENVSDEVTLKEVGQTRGHKIYKEYSEAIRLAKLILRHFDNSLSKTSDETTTVMPFWIDMSLLYEHYVHGMLRVAYGNAIVYQASGAKAERPDFLFTSDSYRAVMDTKYIPKFIDNKLDTYIIRQLSGYARDLKILKKLGCQGLTEDSDIPTVPCIIFYPVEDTAKPDNPFIDHTIEGLCTENEPGFAKFYKIQIPLPLIR